MSSVQVAGFSVEYETYGSPANPAVFMVHGLYLDHLAMATLANRLTDAYYVVAHDALGHGRSAKPDSFTLADQANVLNGLIDALKVRSCAVLGESMGSYIAMQAAFQNPAHIRRLILLAPKAYGPTSSISAYFESQGVDPAKLTVPALFDGLADVLWCPETLPERRRQIEADMVPAIMLSKAEAAVVATSVSGFDLRAELPQIQAKTLVATGKYDGLNPPEAGREVARLIPGARFELFEHSGHILKYEEQVKTGDLIRSFLDS
ncbi:MAG: alpha/beta hydrolase [Propionibacteriaceae bacterium]|jgi:3-oxoadipate enol-lactonase|nr:alpha/beta hydrolase [Propionibacteriaceae bacterium]